MRKARKLLAFVSVVALLSSSVPAAIIIPGTNIPWAPGANTIPGLQPVVNVDGLANYSFAAPFANIVNSFDEGSMDSYLTGYVDGDYAVSWSGGGAPSIAGAKSQWIVTGANTAIFRLKHDNPGPMGGGYFTLNAGGANLKSLQVIAPDRYQNTSFRTPFVNIYKSMVAKSLRFMDVEQTVGNLATTSYSTRNTGFTNISARGWRYEDMLEMAAVLRVPEIWINVPTNVNPAAASDNWLDGIGDLIKQKLPASVKVHLEYSNEGWNTFSPNYAAILNAARANPNLPGPSDYERSNQQNGYMLKLSVDRLRAKLGHDRVIPEFSTLVANPYTLFYQAEQVKRMGVANPAADGYRAAVSYYVPGSRTDVGTITGSDTPASAFAKLDAFKNNNVKAWLTAMKVMADFYGMPVDAYESDYASFYAQGEPALALLAIALQADPQMRPGTVAFIKDFKLINPAGDITQFGMISPFSEFGQWGVTQNVNDWVTSMKLNAWWDSIDYGSVPPAQLFNEGVPEPASQWLLVLLFMFWLWRRPFRCWPSQAQSPPGNPDDAG